MNKYKLQLRANLFDSKISPLINEEGKGEDPIDFKLSKELINDLEEWKKEVIDHYDAQHPSTKLRYEITGLSLVQRLGSELPRWVQLSYYSELYKKEVFFY